MAKRNPLAGNVGWLARETREKLFEKAHFNKQQLRERGWTRTSIKRILGEPDAVFRSTRRRDRPECCYLIERVIAAEDAGRIRYRRSKFDVPLSEKRKPRELHEHEDVWAILNPPDRDTQGIKDFHWY